ncbi:MAG: PIG-L family deacetylase [Firmicutes bacterium]|nr:PIG-L family deacetylase [Bacillota bacterium]
MESLALGRESRLLVVAPHCDDEVLGAGGLLHTVTRAGGAVRVVLLTNGDGYNRTALRGQFRRLRLPPERYIQFAYLRQRETLAALAALGASDSQVAFLGYPDRGLAAMWDDHWQPENPYRSTFTRTTRSPYDNSRTRGAVFCGESLARDLEDIVREFRPTHVAVPHPHDDHGDHWAGCCFTLYALERLRLWGRLSSPPVVLAYLVHQGTWPRPRGYRPTLGLLPPRPYLHLPSVWMIADLPQEAVEQKYRALLCHRSQMVFMGRYLSSFVRRNELFNLIQPATVPRVDAGRIRVDGEPCDWEGIEVQIPVPARDTLARRLGRGADIRPVAACRDSDFLYLLLELRRRVVDDYLYRVILYGMGRKRGLRRLRISVRVPDRVKVQGEGGWEPRGEIVARARNRCLEMAVPLLLLGRPERVFLGVVTRFRRLVVDRVAWQILDVGERHGGP